MAEQSREPFLLPSTRRWAHAAQPLGHTFPALGHLSKRRTAKRKGSLVILGFPTDRIFDVSKLKTANASPGTITVIHRPGDAGCLQRRNRYRNGEDIGTAGTERKAQDLG